MQNLVILLGLLSLSKPLFADEKKDKPLEVFVETAAKTEIYDALVFGGFIEATKEFVVAPEVAGDVTRVFVRLGEKVKRGQVLFKMRPRGAGLEYRAHVVRSQGTGIVSSLAIKPGSNVTQGKQVMMVSDVSRLVLPVQTTKDDLANLKLGEELAVVGQEKVKAKIVAKSPSADPKLGTYRVDLEIPCQSKCLDHFPLRSYVKVQAKRNSREVILVPIKSLVHNRRKVFTLDKDNKVAAHKVKLGVFRGVNVEIVSGLKAGDRFVTHHSRYPKEKEVAVIKKRDEERQKVLSKVKSKPKQS